MSTKCVKQRLLNIVQKKKKAKSFILFKILLCIQKWHILKGSQLFQIWVFEFEFDLHMRLYIWQNCVFVALSYMSPEISSYQPLPHQKRCSEMHLTDRVKIWIVMLNDTMKTIIKIKFTIMSFLSRSSYFPNNISSLFPITNF